MIKFHLYKQLDTMDCGPTCLRMIARHFGRNLSLQELRQASEVGKNGVNLLGIAQAAERFGFRTLSVKVSLNKLKKDAPLPFIAYWSQNHFVVVYKILLIAAAQSLYRGPHHTPISSLLQAKLLFDAKWSFHQTTILYIVQCV